MNAVKVSELISSNFYDVHKAIKSDEYTHFWLKGGRGSLKSSFVSLQIPLGIMRDPNANAMVLRKIGNEIKGSVFEQIRWALEMLNVEDYWIERQSPPHFIYKPTGQKIVFNGADKPRKIKSTKFARGYCKYVWYEEVDEFLGIHEIDTINQSLIRGGDVFKYFYTYNPPKSRNNWVNHHILEERQDKLVHHSNYLQAPFEWLGEQIIIEAQHLKKVNYDRYCHEYLGEVIGTGGEVFNNLTLRRITDEEIDSFDRIYRGIDWGYSTDPFAYAVCYFDRTRKKLYIFDEIYKVRLSNSKVAFLMKEKGIGSSEVLCDHEPKSIDDLKDNLINARPALKGKGSVEHGMKFLTDEIEEIIIDPMRCPNTAREFSNYELEADSFGGFKSGYPDKDNHSIDSVRYALSKIRGATRR